MEVVPGSYVSTLWQRSVEQGEKGSVVVTVLGASPVPFDAHPEATLLSFRDAVEVEPATGSLVGWSRSTTWRVQEGPGKVAEWSLAMTLAPTSQGTLDAATVQSIREGYKELDTLRALAKSDSGAALLRARAAAPRYFGTMLEERFRRQIQSLEEGDRQERPKSGQPVEGAHL
ncbi:hypothetical protein L6R50_16950 [Myxococcota bacterium]|nr:hypothetical protein [Myxococcota bacterium]